MVTVENIEVDFAKREDDIAAICRSLPAGSVLKKLPWGVTLTLESGADGGLGCGKQIFYANYTKLMSDFPNMRVVTRCKLDIMLHMDPDTEGQVSRLLAGGLIREEYLYTRFFFDEYGKSLKACSLPKDVRDPQRRRDLAHGRHIANILVESPIVSEDLVIVEFAISRLEKAAGLG